MIVSGSVFKRLSEQAKVTEMEKLDDLFSGRTSKINRPDRDGIWKYSPDEGMIRRQAVRGKDTIGDIRISYWVPKDLQVGHVCSVLGCINKKGHI